MAGIEKDHWIWNTRANDTELIMEGFSFAAESDFYGFQQKLLNLLPLVRLRT